MYEETSVKSQLPEEIVAILKVLVDPNRLRVFEALMCGTSCNAWLTEELGLPANLLSHHLKVLREAGLVQDRRDTVDGRWIYYQVDLEALTILYQRLTQFFDPTRAVMEPRMCGPEGKLPRHLTLRIATKEAAA